MLAFIVLFLTKKKMSKRDVFLKEFRGEAIGNVTSQSASDEIFQNEILRPILKLQNELLIAAFTNYIFKSKSDFHTQTAAKKLVTIETIVQKDMKFQNTLKGMIIGLFTLEEYLWYTKNASSLNKRMMAMLIERLKSQLQLF